MAFPPQPLARDELAARAERLTRALWTGSVTGAEQLLAPDFWDGRLYPVRAEFLAAGGGTVGRYVTHVVVEHIAVEASWVAVSSRASLLDHGLPTGLREVALLRLDRQGRFVRRCSAREVLPHVHLSHPSTESHPEGDRE